MNNSIAIDPKIRFAFGKNWANFLENLTESRIVEAEQSLKQKLGCNNLNNLTFLDVGSGSGLFSLAAHRLGATVHSFDYDLDSVACTKYLQQKYAANNINWTVEHGSVLDQNFLKNFGPVDILYSWGVLHHTGHMYDAFANVASLVKHGGILFISIYNDQGFTSKIWKCIKKTYANYKISRLMLLWFCGLWIWKYKICYGLIRYGNPLKFIFEYGKNDRGMSAWHDVIDLVGGYPFEVAKPEEVFNFFKSKNFELQRLKTCAGGVGCNEFVFSKK